MFGVRKAMDPGPQWLATLFDTSASVEDPKKPKEIGFELGFAEPDGVYLKEGSYVRRAGQGSPFWTDRKKHVLCIVPVYTSGCTQNHEFVIDYGSICAIASENGSTSRVPWDLWKHKTTRLRECGRYPQALAFVGPRVFTIDEEPHQGALIRSLDFTPSACRSTEQTDTPSGDAPRYTTRRTILSDVFPEGLVEWSPSEDNILGFVVSWWVSFWHSYSSATLLQRTSLDGPRDLEIWTF